MNRKNPYEPWKDAAKRWNNTHGFHIEAEFVTYVVKLRDSFLHYEIGNRTRKKLNEAKETLGNTEKDRTEFDFLENKLPTNLRSMVFSYFNPIDSK